MSNGNRVIDTLKKEQLIQYLQDLDVPLTKKNYLKPELKNMLIEALNSKNRKGKCDHVFAKVPKIVAIGDLHGDLVATIKALKLAGVIDVNTPNTLKNINKIVWTGGKTVVVQLGDQIDRVRPQNLVNDLCPENDSELNSDEGSDLKIICLFEKLHREAQQVGGAVFSILGNHELMNVDGDFRYVSPREFSEFGNHFKERRSDDTTLPFGYAARKAAFAPGGIIAKKLADGRFAVLQVGSWLFVHGGISLQCAQKFALNDINYYVKRWLNGHKDSKTMAYMNMIYHGEEDLSPFWTRVFSDLEDWDEERSTANFMETLHTLNANNKRTKQTEIKGMIMGHSPQFMYNKGLNSACGNRLWRTDVGMSRAFGKLNTCKNELVNRRVQILVIENDTKFRILRED
jgi:hypothetical protein